MRKVRFFKSIFLEALDQRTTLILGNQKEAVQKLETELQNQQRTLDRKIYEYLDLLITVKDSALTEYKIRQLYVVEKHVAKRSASIARKSVLITILAIFEEILIELRSILVNELFLLDHQVLQISELHLLHGTITNEIPIYSKTINKSWIQIKQAMAIVQIINQPVDSISDEVTELVTGIHSITRFKLKNEKEILAFTDSGYLQDVTKTIEVYFTEMIDKINESLKKGQGAVRSADPTIRPSEPLGGKM